MAMADKIARRREAVRRNSYGPSVRSNVLLPNSYHPSDKIKVFLYQGSRAFVDDFKLLESPTFEDVCRHLAHRGPLFGAVHRYKDFSKFHGQGVFRDSLHIREDGPRHFVYVEWFDTSTRSLVAKNSHGDYFGEEGFARIEFTCFMPEVFGYPINPRLQEFCMESKEMMKEEGDHAAVNILGQEGTDYGSILQNLVGLSAENHEERAGDASDTMNDLLSQVATKTEPNKSAGNAILYEYVATIMSIEDNGGLRVLAVNILGRFLSSKDNNIRYVALNMLMKAIALDSQAVQRHRATILECVKDSDASIRKRALELIYLLVNENNVKSLTKDLVDYLEISDLEFKGDLTSKICSIVEKFSPEKLWYIDQMLKVLSQAGNYVKDDVWHALVVVITNASNLHGYAVRSLYRAVQTAGEQETLVRVAVWCIGEYGEMLVHNVGVLDVEDPITVTEADTVDVVETAITRHSMDLTTRAMCLIALFKLSSRFPSCSKRINNIVLNQKGSLALELQQRAIEFNSIIEKHENIRSTLVERMPVLDESTYIGRRAGSVPAAVSTSQGALPKLPNGVAKSPAAPLVDLLDLSSDEPIVPSAPGGDFLQDLLGVNLSPTSLQGTYPSVVAFESSTLKMTFNFSKEPGNQKTSLIEAQFQNKSPNTYLNFVFQAAVPKFLQLHLDPASSNTLPASGDGSITQKLRVTNSQHGKKSLVMQIRINYKAEDKDVLEEGQISNFPRGL